MSLDLEVTYATWKQLAQAHGWTTYHELAGPQRAYVWSGDRDHIYKARVDGVDHTDWGSSFPTSSLVLKAEDAIAQIIGTSGITPAPITVDSTPLWSLRLPKTDWSWAQWSGGTQTVGTSWVDVYTLTTQGVFQGAVWQVNTYKMLLQIEIDGALVVDLDMEELRKDFKFEHDESTLGITSWLSEYESNRWRFQPPEPLRFDTSFKVRLKSASGSKKCYRGITVWRTL